MISWGFFVTDMIYNKKYKNYLFSKEWKERRDFVIKRDGGKCLLCSSTENLNVHHLIYINKNPIIVKDKDLVTLCYKCHMAEHKKFKLKEFNVSTKKRQITQNPKKKLSKAEKMYNKLPKHLKKLEDRYRKHKLQS